MEETNGKWKERTQGLSGNCTEKSLNLIGRFVNWSYVSFVCLFLVSLFVCYFHANLRSMDIGVIVDEKLAVHYVGDDEDKARRKLKRKVVFKQQVQKSVEYMLVRPSPSS